MPTYTDPVLIDGSQDDPQLRVQGHTTQTDQLQTWENSSGVVLAQVDGNGQLLIHGSQDIPLLRVQAHSTQTEPLQTWENSAGTPLAQITNDGRLEIGNNAIDGPPAALIEANQGNIGAGSAVKQGIQSCGDISGAINEPLTWSVHELEFGGGGGVSSNHTGLRSKITQNNTGSSPTAEMRAGEFKVENNQTLNKAVAVRAEISNASGGNITEATALEAVLPTAGTIGTMYGLRIPDLLVGTNRYAIKTGFGAVHFGDSVGIGTVPSAKFHVAQENTTLYTLLENVTPNADVNNLLFRRARGTSLAAKAIVSSSDLVGRLSFQGWDGVGYQNVALIDAFVDGIPGVGDMPGGLIFRTTPDGSATPVESMRISQNGEVTARDYVLNKAAGNPRALYFRTSGVNRWVVFANSTPETGSDGGSDFAIGAYHDNGAWITDNSPYLSIIRSNGYVGIETGNPAYRLDVAGAAHASSFPVSSDERLKKNVQVLEAPLEKLRQLRGVRFQWNATYEATGRGQEGEWQVGIIAQEVEAQFPDLVSRWYDKENDTDFLAVDYSRMAAIFIEAIKAQQVQIEALQAQVAALAGGTSR